MATQNTNPTDNIFSGLKVVDFASFVAGPGAAVILSDFGADVIKVEPPKGELWRIGNKIPPQPQSKYPYMWHLNNRNKRGVAIDLKSPDAAKIVERLAKWADVFIVNTPHPAREKLKLDYDHVAQFNPRQREDSLSSTRRSLKEQPRLSGPALLPLPKRSGDATARTVTSARSCRRTGR